MLKLFFFLIFSALLITKPLYLKGELPVIGYGQSNAIISTRELENFYSGFDLGFVNKKKLFKVFSAKDNSGLPDGPLSALTEILAKNPIGIFGFPTSHEALMVAKVVAEKNILTIFGGASHQDLARMKNSIYSVGDSAESSLQKLISHLNKNHGGKKGILFRYKYSVFSRNMIDIFTALFEKQKRRFKFQIVDVEKDGKIGFQKKENIKFKDFDFYFFSDYVDVSSVLVEQLKSLGLEKIIYSTASWCTANSPQLMRSLINWKPKVFSQAAWHINLSETQKFVSKFKNKYGVAPNDENALGYDLGVIANALTERIQGKESTAANFLKAFLEKPCFENTSIGKLCFDKKGGFAIKKIRMAVLENGQFRLLEK